MPKRRPPAKKTRRRVTKPQGRHRRRRITITPAQARRLAAQHTLTAMFEGATVKDGAEGHGNFMRDQIAGAWLVFPKVPQEPGIIGSSWVVAVCKRTGKVLFAGSAGDEG
jgi:hypothetical protein